MHASSLVDVLHSRAERHGERPLYQLIVDGEIVATSTYADADRRARALATALRERTEIGDRVLLLYPFGLEYTTVFFACLYAGLIAVPAFPPDQQRAVKTMPRVSAIIRDADAKLILTTAELAPTVEFARAEARDPAALEILATDEIATDDRDAEAWRRPDQLEREVAFLQYTSGSTGTPKGVMIGHDNLIAHQRLAHDKFGQPEAARTVSWLPFYHDMGLIGALLYPLYHGGTTLLMSPTAFLRRPMTWLEMVSKFSAAVSTGPNFAYDLCVEKARDEDIAQLDLSSWKLTVSGAEPLRASTIERFCARFESAGFRPETFMPCFGMAEATLMVSGWPLELAPSIRWFDKRALEAGRAEPVDEHALTRAELESRARPYVSCGTPMAEHHIAIVEPESRVRLADGREGEIWLRGPSVGRGYFGDAPTTAERFAATIVGEGDDEWFRTADTGFVVDGELFGTGRLADLIVVDGRTYQPHDIERSVAEGPQPLVPDCVVFCVSDGRGGQHVCLAGTGRRTMAEEARAQLCERIHERVKAEFGIDLDRVLLIPQRTVAKTTSGKLRRYRYRTGYLSGELEILSERVRTQAQ